MTNIVAAACSRADWVM